MKDSQTKAKERDMIKNEELEYVFCPSILGTLLVARSGKGICAILIGSSQKSLMKNLKERFPGAAIGKGAIDLMECAKKIAYSTDHPTSEPNLPLDIRGTDFQKRVWRALRQIPPGKTASYTEIAEKIGAPKSVRALAGACAANPLSIVVPCHRVVRSDGALSGYYWGVARKRKLLQIEGAR
nr:MAG: methylated-DNA--[protein]-cysteine S-methyltransferase [Hyphomicrobiales bacterium]